MIPSKIPSSLDYYVNQAQIQSDLSKSFELTPDEKTALEDNLKLISSGNGKSIDDAVNNLTSFENLKRVVRVRNALTDVPRFERGRLPELQKIIDRIIATVFAPPEEPVMTPASLKNKNAVVTIMDLTGDIEPTEKPEPKNSATKRKTEDLFDKIDEAIEDLAFPIDTQPVEQPRAKQPRVEEPKIFVTPHVQSKIKSFNEQMTNVVALYRNGEREVAREMFRQMDFEFSNEAINNIYKNFKESFMKLLFSGDTQLDIAGARQLLQGIMNQVTKALNHVTVVTSIPKVSTPSDSNGFDRDQMPSVANNEKPIPIPSNPVASGNSSFPRLPPGIVSDLNDRKQLNPEQVANILSAQSPKPRVRLYTPSNEKKEDNESASMKTTVYKIAKEAKKLFEEGKRDEAYLLLEKSIGTRRNDAHLKSVLERLKKLAAERDAKKAFMETRLAAIGAFNPAPTVPQEFAVRYNEAVRGAAIAARATINPPANEPQAPAPFTYDEAVKMRAIARAQAVVDAQAVANAHIAPPQVAMGAIWRAPPVGYPNNPPAPPVQFGNPPPLPGANILKPTQAVPFQLPGTIKPYAPFAKPRVLEEAPKNPLPTPAAPQTTPMDMATEAELLAELDATLLAIKETPPEEKK